MDNRHHFLIVGFGSSGTRFLAETLNRSDFLTVQHEGCPHRKPELLDKANEWYGKRKEQAERHRQTYGDVNGYMRYRLPEYQFTHKALILRDWRQILMSWASYFGKPYPVGSPEWTGRVQAEIKRRKWMWHVEETVKIFEKYCHNVIPIIYFSRMVSSPAYIQNICFQFGALDLQPTYKDLARKVNSHNKGRIANYDEIPAVIRGPFDRITEKFNEKWILPYEHRGY